MTKTKPSHPRRTSPTHFEQIPLEVVKELTAEEWTETRNVGTSNLIMETPAGKTEPYGRWLRSIGNG